MSKVLVATVAMLMATCAAAQEMGASQPVDTVSIGYVVAFLILFFGMIGYFFVRIWLNERRKKQPATQA